MSAVSSQPAVNPMKQVFAIRDFLLLSIGQATSMLGDQFHTIAGAWLVLIMTGDPMSLGLVMAVGGLPRVIFTMIGGAVTDRVSPRKVMLATDIIRLLFSAMLALQVFTGTLQVWMIYVYTLLIGIVSGLFGPASMSIVPVILPEENLQAGNSVTQGSAQLIGFLGPALAGALIAIFPDEKIGVGSAFAFDALTFLVSVFTLWMMQPEPNIVSTVKFQPAGILRSIRDGIGYIIQDPFLRLMFIIIAFANLSFGGPAIVGIPYLADTRFVEGAAAYGIIISGYAGGNLLGIILSGILPSFSGKVVYGFLVIMMLMFGFGLGAIGWISITWLAALDLFILGILNGYLSILLITGLQRRTPREMLGRLMSMVMLANLALMPISQVVSGVVLRWNASALFAGAGLMMLGLAFYLAVPSVGLRLSNELVSDKSDG